MQSSYSIEYDVFSDSSDTSYSIHDHICSASCGYCLRAATAWHKILEGENFGELQEICQNFLIQNFPFYKSWYIAS